MQYLPFENQKTQMIKNKYHCHRIGLKNILGRKAGFGFQ